uniref:Retrotransposon gag domain-containing protein n=1 Tax=Ananas comosus var. bracteatus TaxID=296719 RepID=A0A6V7NJE5_ANACO|nr:unnamed protein product [Ananas comosus var. bracteatus]
MENPEGDHGPLDMPKGSLEDTTNQEDFENPFHDARTANNAVRSGLEERLLHALDLNSSESKIEVADFYENMHTEDYLDWEASIDNYFKWKPMVENRKVLFVKLKLKGTALQWWKIAEEQHAWQGKPKVNTWEQMKIKLRKQFLPLIIWSSMRRSIR